MGNNKNEFDYLTPEEIRNFEPSAGGMFLIRNSDNFPLCECYSEQEAKAICNALNKDSENVLKAMEGA